MRGVRKRGLPNLNVDCLIISTQAFHLDFIMVDIRKCSAQYKSNIFIMIYIYFSKWAQIYMILLITRLPRRFDIISQYILEELRQQKSF